MGKRSFGRVLDGIVSVVLASAIGSVAVAGCGGTAATTTGVGDGGGGPLGPVGQGAPGFEDEDTFSCGMLAGVLTNLKPAVAVDYVELRTQTFDDPRSPKPYLDAGDAGGGDAGVAARPPKTTASNGTACATATNKAACNASLAAAKVEAGTMNNGWRTPTDGGNYIPPTYDVEFLVYTRGDEVGIVRSKEELVTFLGKIDTLEEARLVLQSNSANFYCTETPRKSGWKQATDGSWEVLISGQSCGIPYRVRVRAGADGSYSVVATDVFENTAVCGRRPEGLSALGAAGAEVGLGAYFAEVAYLEAASVVAFRRLEEELIRHGAPAELVRRARRSRADEIRHARETSALARRFGAAVAPLDIAPMTERDQCAMAIENAAEGCVRETYGALVAAFQARTAADPEVARVLAGIARDEARHAELSHDVAMWLDTQLDAKERARVDSARASALAELRHAIASEPAADVAHFAGMPTAREARALLAGLEREVLAA